MSFANFEYMASAPEDGAVENLVLLLHGYGRNARAMDKMAHAIRKQLPQAMILNLHAPEMMRPARFAPDDVLHTPDDAPETDFRRQWFAIEGGLSDLMPRLKLCAERLNRFIDIQRDFLGLQDRNIALVGFSQGAGTALYTAYHRATEIGAVICHSAIIINRSIPDHDLKSAPKTLYLYGDADPEFPQALYQDSYHWIKNQTAGRCHDLVLHGLRHTTNTESRKACAAYLKDHI